MNRRRTRSALSLVGGVALLAATLSVAQSASAHESAPRTQTARHAVFVATNDATGNQVIAYARGTDGQLAETARYATGGAGGRLDGPVFDPLASQGSLSFDADHGLLYAANAGSDTVTVFAVHGSSLTRLQVLPTQGHIPLSVGFAENVVYVLNAGGDGAITGFVVDDGRLRPIPGSTRSLNLGNPTIPFHLNAPGQVAVTPDAKDVIVTTKLHNQIIVFPLGRGQRPEAPVVTASAAPVPFAVSFDASGRLLVAEASGSASSYTVHRDGTLTLISGPVANGQKATCWSVTAKGFLFTANAGTNTVTGYREDRHGVLSLVDASGVTAATEPGPIDVATSSNGQFLYQLLEQSTGDGTIAEFAVGDDGSLTRIGTVTGLSPNNATGVEGIAAT
jgi:6-phosphogluconolactonase (cycloisomerase 2 family)